ncbi:NADH dehydrogenase [ubiquinone] 1 subunit C2 [Hemicordylus capensis]|uniref:NADH dehydrogenase [ubiquinone] 1 subunit C2 n=1 Tax=Hemicordylus capensis TaxID=884348 RepID=UPI0023039242|nr:NADH dehydrogenase [ubiquinone] 1 subunit C2 [Hemicordylus capensis]
MGLFPLQIRLPDDARSLPPQPVFSPVSLWMGFMGWVGALLENGINQRPILGCGVHRQVLWVSAFFYAGYWWNKRSTYNFAKRDRDIAEYIRHHPEDFKAKEKKTMAEVLEKFYPVR